MKLDLNELAANVGKSHHYEIDEDCGSEEYSELQCVKPITGSADFTNTGSLIVARGRFSTVIELECSRCLEKLTVPIEVKIEEQFPITSVGGVPVSHEEEIEEEEKEPLFENNIFDLSEFIRQSVLVEAPIRPLCNDVCKGLCPTCGRNLNEGPCDCPVSVDASPFSALKEMLDEESENDKE